MEPGKPAAEEAFFPCTRKVDAFRPGMPCPYEIQTGRRVVVEVADCFGRFPGAECEPWFGNANPVTGPIRIAGAMPGDTLAIRIERIEVVGDGFVGSDTERIVVPLDQERNLAHFPGGPSIPLAPHLGTIGLTPADGEASTRIAGNHGGNMDCKRIVAGSTICFRVQVPGAGLGIGDTHAVMGDGETGGQGLEAAARVTMRADIVPGLPIDTPCGLCRDCFYLIGWGTTLDAAADMAQERACGLLGRLLPGAAMPPWKLLGSIADLRVCWCGGPVAVMRMEIPLARLPRHASAKLKEAMGVD